MLSQKVLVMIPAYNEENTVGEVVKSTLALHNGYRVVVIDDGSEDETARKAEEAGADVVSLPFHCGGSIVMQTGYLIAARQGYEYMVKIDADGQHKPEEITRLLDPLINGEADLTMGSRYLRLNGEDASMVKEGGRVFSSTLVSMFRKMEITDVTSGMRAWGRKAVKALLSMYEERGFVDDSVFWVVETLLASRNGLRLKEVPIEVLPRKSGRSKSFSTAKMLLYPLRLLTTLVQEARR
jgi:glycosyltransferase involved in cell wall biosynthesis